MEAKCYFFRLVRGHKEVLQSVSYVLGCSSCFLSVGFGPLDQMYRTGVYKGLVSSTKYIASILIQLMNPGCKNCDAKTDQFYR